MVQTDFVCVFMT